MLAIQGNMIVKLRDQNVGQQTAMLSGIGRLGAGSCTIRSLRRQDFLIRAT